MAEDRNGEVSTQGECTDCTSQERSFDALARGLANGGISRRRALRLLGGALLGGAVASIPGVGWLAGSNGAAQAQVGGPGPGGSTCVGNGQSCTAQKCCEGYTCLIDMTSGTEKFCCPALLGLTGIVCSQVCCPVGTAGCDGDKKCACPPGQIACGRGGTNPGACVNPLEDEQNCGGCDKRCAQGATCTMGTCLCPPGETVCGANPTTGDPGTCRNLNTSLENCGACGHQCPASQPNAGPPVCAGGECVYTCDAGFASCDNVDGVPATHTTEDDQNGCETNIFEDVNNCGGCGNRCPGPGDDQPCGKAVCREGQCQIVADETKKDVVVCRPKAGDCDVAETCNGLIAECPPDLFLAVDTVCRPAAPGGCDVPEVCTGLSAQCPENAFAPRGTPCRNADPNNQCEGVALCPGDSAQCPENPILPVDTVCRPAAPGGCDVPEVCNGTSRQCPPNAFAPQGTPCRDPNPANACEGIARCPGGSATCPENPILAQGTVCRPAVNQCDVQEVCNGTSRQCPNDVKQPNNTPCDRDQNLCTLDTCQNGVCTAGPQKTCPAHTNQCKQNVCVPATGQCVEQNRPNGTICESNNNPCTIEECRNGTCTTTTRTQPVNTVCGCTGGNPPQPKCCNAGGNCGTGQCPAGTTIPAGMTCPS